jgi:hypothetical protein
MLGILGPPQKLCLQMKPGQKRHDLAQHAVDHADREAKNQQNAQQVAPLCGACAQVGNQPRRQPQQRCRQLGSIRLSSPVTQASHRRSCGGAARASATVVPAKTATPTASKPAPASSQSLSAIPPAYRPTTASAIPAINAGETAHEPADGYGGVIWNIGTT